MDGWREVRFVRREVGRDGGEWTAWSGVRTVAAAAAAAAVVVEAAVVVFEVVVEVLAVLAGEEVEEEGSVGGVGGGVKFLVVGGGRGWCLRQRWLWRWLRRRRWWWWRVSLQPAASPAGSLTGGGLRRSCARIV